VSVDTDDETDTDVLELGERAADWLLRDELGQCYSDLQDRAWSATLGCFAKCVTSLGAENVPEIWRPAIGEDGMWTGWQRPARKQAEES
jgi:hypothetical protein